MSQLSGYDDGFAPPLAYRPQTHSRTPDAVLFTVQHGGLAQSGDFRRDPS
jgi:hypothetical protein